MSARPKAIVENLKRERELHARLTPALRAELYGRALNILKDGSLADDAVQLAMLEAWRKPVVLAPENRRLLYRIVRCHALKVLREERRHAHELPEEPSDVPVED